MGDTAQANDGAQLPLDSLPQQFTYDGTFISTISVYYQGNLYIQTFLNDGAEITYISGWVNSSADIPSGELMVDNTGNIMVDSTGAMMVTT
jgi:hypothetical protein